jgi:Multiubiquitin
MSQTLAEPHLDATKPVTVHVNTKPVELPSHKVTGLEIKQAAIAQGVEIQVDFLLTEEAHGEHPARTIADSKKIEVTKKSEFTANSEDDDS